MSLLLAGALALAQLITASNASMTNSTPEALDPLLTNLVPNAKGGPTLYYNGSGPVPPYNMTSPVPTPITPFNSSMIEDNIYNEVIAIVNGTAISSDCDKCIAATEIMHIAAITQPVSTITTLLIELCNNIPAFYDTIYAKTCEAEFAGVGGQGPYFAQLLAEMSQATEDMQGLCWFYSACDLPATIAINESTYFSTKPASADIPKTPSGESINVLHISDWHLDSRYDIGSEADCSQYLCCRPYSTNTKLHTNVNNATVPASRFGYLYCDAPADLALSSFTSMPTFFDMNEIEFTIFTGDIVSHDNDDQLSRAYVEYEETVTYQTFKAELGNIPVYATLGNHDSLPEAYNTPNYFDPTSSNSSNVFSWNYELLSSMWSSDGWITEAEAEHAALNYGAYAHTTKQGLRIISINTDFWYVDNIFNYAKFNDPDPSGVLTFLANELTACETAGQRAWIIGHVLSGYDGTNALPNPSALFYSIVRRFSPSTIAGVFFGHTHEDQLEIFYDYLPNSSYVLDGATIRNTTMVDYSKPLMIGYIAPSITPLTGVNAGYQRYQIDAHTFEVTGLQTYFANVSDSLNWVTPEWEVEYDARSTYNVNGTWPDSAPLNATFWNDVTYSMLSNQSLVETYNLYETKSSVVTKNCTSKACGMQKVCYIRSGSAALGLACPQDSGPF